MRSDLPAFEASRRNPPLTMAERHTKIVLASAVMVIAVGGSLMFLRPGQSKQHSRRGCHRDRARPTCRCGSGSTRPLPSAESRPFAGAHRARSSAASRRPSRTRPPVKPATKRQTYEVGELPSAKLEPHASAPGRTPAGASRARRRNAVGPGTAILGLGRPLWRTVRRQSAGAGGPQSSAPGNGTGHSSSSGRRAASNGRARHAAWRQPQATETRQPDAGHCAGADGADRSRHLAAEPIEPRRLRGIIGCRPKIRSSTSPSSFTATAANSRSCWKPIAI